MEDGRWQPELKMPVFSFGSLVPSVPCCKNFVDFSLRLEVKTARQDRCRAGEVLASPLFMKTDLPW